MRSENREGVWGRERADAKSRLAGFKSAGPKNTVKTQGFCKPASVCVNPCSSLYKNRFIYDFN